MTRIGINPARGKTTDRRPARTTICVLTYIPDLSGYFEGRLDVLRLCLASLKAHTSPEHDLLVFDNGSCTQTIDLLTEAYRAGEIDYLILSPRNIGKIDALKIMFHAAPGEVIAYNDDDIFFYPGWLEAHLELLDSFPQAGMVSGVAVRNAANHARQSLEHLAEAPPPGMQATRERRIPDAWEADWAASTGRNPQAHLQATEQQQDLVLRIEKPGGEFCEAIAGANHFQFIAPKAIIQQALPSTWTGKLMGSMIELDEAVDAQGRLRVSTAARYTRHMGNALSPEIIGEARAFGLESTSKAGIAAKPKAAAGRRPWILRIPGARRVLSGLYNRLFKILYAR